MFSYQRNFFEETQVVTPELFNSLFDDPQYASRWKVLKRREVLKEGCTEYWLATEEYQEWARRMATDASKDGKAFRQAPDDRQRVVLWCEWLKKTLPSLMFMAWFDETVSAKGNKGRWRKKVATNLSGLVVLDIDHLKEDPRTVFDSWTEEQRRDIVFCMKSPGGEGLKVVFKAHREWGNLADNIIEKSLQLGLQPDFSGIDSTRACFVSLREDIYYINEQELFNYENQEFAEEWREVYRAGGTVYPTRHNQDDYHRTGAADVHRADHADAAGPADGAAVPSVEAADVADAYRLSYEGWTGTCQELMEEIYREVGEPGSQTEDKPRLSRHGESLKRAYDLLVMTGRNKKLVEQMLRALPWVDAIVKERGEDVGETVSSADARVKEAEKKYASPKPSKAVQEAVRRLTGSSEGKEKTDEEEAQLPLEEWGEQIEQLFDHYPCLREALRGLPKAGYAAGLFTTAAFMGTLMTRTWYYFYHRPEERRRLNYCIMVIGDPASGKSFATRLYKLLAAPIKTADKVGYDAVNRYKEETRQKGANKEKPKKPVVIIRDHPARTSNATFIQDMNNAVETIDGEPMHLHMLTFDSELDNATLTQRGGSWIDKTSLELKAFHNEEDGQAYSNLDSISGVFNVFWNFVYTGTPLSLQRKVTERNFGSGLATRLACIPLPPSGFRMMAMKRTSNVNHVADEALKTWAFRLDGVKGELPLWPLVDEVWQWTNEHMEVAAYNQDKADELLLKRVAYYGVCVSAPFILMRHWDEWKEHSTFTIDDKDRALSRLVMDIQYRCQHFFFGEYARAYFDNMQRDAAQQRRRTTKYTEAYRQLPKEFKIEDVCKHFNLGNKAASVVTTRLLRDGYIERIKKGQFKKLKLTLV